MQGIGSNQFRSRGTIDPSEYLTDSLLEFYKRQIKVYNKVLTTPVIYKALYNSDHLTKAEVDKVEIAKSQELEDLNLEASQEIMDQLV